MRVDSLAAAFSFRRRRLFIARELSLRSSLPYSTDLRFEGVGRHTSPYRGRSASDLGGRQVPLCAELRAALQALKSDDARAADARVIHSERDIGLSAGAIMVWFHRLYNRLGLKGASSHSGRRTFVTELAKTIVAHGGSLRDVQQLAGHAHRSPPRSATSRATLTPSVPLSRLWASCE
jgi:integrase